MEITDKMAIDILKKLIADKTKELNNMPIFLDEEIEVLQMEINIYKTHLKKMVRCCQ